MGANTSAPIQPEPAARYLGDYGEVNDSISPIFGTDSATGGDNQIKAADGEHLELGAVLDELRRKRLQAKGNKTNHAASSESDASEHLSSSDESELRVGKLHRERAERSADAEHKGVVGQTRTESAETLLIEGAPTPLSVLKLRDEVAILTGPEYSIKWYLSDDIGTLDVFQVLPIAEGISCEVPLRALGRFIKAICTLTSTEYKRKGYETTVGEAFDPITGERIQGSDIIRVTTSATTGPIMLPPEWYDLYTERLIEDAEAPQPLSVFLAIDGEKPRNALLAILPPLISLSEISGSIQSFAAKLQTGRFDIIDHGLTISLNDAVVRLICSGDEMPQMEIAGRSKKSAKLRIQCPDTGETDISDLLFTWGLVICAQASAGKQCEDDLSTLFQKWLEQNRRWSLVS